MIIDFFGISNFSIVLFVLLIYYFRFIRYELFFGEYTTLFCSLITSMGGLISGDECVSESSLKSFVFSFSLVFFAYNLNYYFINAVLRALGLVFLIR